MINLSFTNKNGQATSPTNKFSFTRRKINVQVSRREKSTCNKFHEEKPQNATLSINKTVWQKITVKLSLREKSTTHEKEIKIQQISQRSNPLETSEYYYNFNFK